MPGSVTSVFGEAERFETALREEGCTGLFVAEGGEFRARLTQITLDRLRLASAEEELARIAVIAVPANTVLISWPSSKTPASLWGGIAMKAGEMMTLDSGNRVHARTGGPSRWHAIRLPETDLLCYGRALCGAGFILPPSPALWRPSPAAARSLAGLHRAAIKMAQSASRSLSDIQAAHGLEQQLIYALIGCLSGRPAEEETPAGDRYRNILAQLEDLLEVDPITSLTETCARLGVSHRFLRKCCEHNLGMSPGRYHRLRRLLLAHRALRNGGLSPSSVSSIARRFGFRELGRFAASYRGLYDELPSATLRRASCGDPYQLSVMHQNRSGSASANRLIKS
jgi:AraC-like DNA-binding protein